MSASRSGLSADGVRKRSARIRGLHVAALHQFAQRIVIGRGRELGVGEIGLGVPQARHRLEHRDRIVGVREQRAELARVDETGHVARTIDLGRTRGRIHHRGRRHRVAAGIGVLRSDERQQLAVGADAVDAVHRVVRVVAGVVLGTRRDAEAIDVGARGSLRRGQHAAQDRAVGMPGGSELGVDEVVSRAGRVGGSRRHVARQSERGVTLRREEVERIAVHADQHLGTLQVRAAGEVEANERNLARARGDVADVRGEVLERRAHRAARLTSHERAEHRTTGDDGRTRAKALRNEIATRHRRLVALVLDGLVETQGARALLEDIHALLPTESASRRCRAQRRKPIS